MTATDVGNHFGNKEWVEARNFFTLEKITKFFGERIKSANTRTPNDAYAVFVGVRSLESRISHGLLSSDKPEVGAAIHAARLFAFNKVFDI